MSEVVEAAARFTDAVSRGDDAGVRQVLMSPLAAEMAVYLAEMLNDTVEPVPDARREEVLADRLAVAERANLLQSDRIDALTAKVAELREMLAEGARRSTASQRKAA